MDAGNVKWVRLGDYIEQCDERNHSNKYGIEAIKGISTYGHEIEMYTVEQGEKRDKRQ